MGYKKGERYSTMMIIGCFLSAILFEGLLAFLNWLPAFCLTYQNMTGVGINYVTYFIIGFIVATLMIFLSVLAMKFIFKCDFSKLNNIDVEALKSEGIGRLNFRHKFYLVCFGLIVAYVILTTVLPADFFLTVRLVEKRCWSCSFFSTMSAASSRACSPSAVSTMPLWVRWKILMFSSFSSELTMALRLVWLR